MEAVAIDAKLREKTKKESAKEYRREGLIPSVIYGQGNNVNILIDSRKFSKLSTTLTKSTIINLKTDNGKEYKVLIKDYQKDYIKDKFTHIDFYELNDAKPVHFRIHLNFIGTPMGVRDGGVLERQMIEMDVECLPKDIVSHIDVNVESLNINESLHVRDIKLDGKYKVLSHADDVVVHVSGKMAEEEEKVATEEMTVDKVETATQKAPKEEEKKEEKADTKEK